jgi:hypothetical protein
MPDNIGQAFGQRQLGFAPESLAFCAAMPGFAAFEANAKAKPNVTFMIVTYRLGTA